MRAAFIPALPPSALLAGMIAPSFRLVNRFCGKSCFARTALRGRPRCARYFLGRRSLMCCFARAALRGRPRCARYFLGRRSLMCCFARAAAMSGRPRCARYGLCRRSLMSKGPCPLTARCGMGRLCGERRRRERFERPSGARNAACSTRHRPPPGLPPAPAVGWFGGVRRPLQVYSESSDMRGGFGSLASARLPYAASRPGALRRRARGKRRTPGGKDRRQPGFSDALYSIIASASLTSSIRRATCAGVSTGWLNSTVWFTVTAGVSGDCAACAVRRPS